MRSKPSLDKGFVTLIIILFQGKNLIFPNAIHLFTNIIVLDFGQYVTLQHLCRGQAEATVIHGNKDFVRILLRGCNNLNEENLFGKPITEM